MLRQNLELAHEYDDHKLKLAKVATNKTEYAEMKTRWVDTFMVKVMNAAADA